MIQLNKNYSLPERLAEFIPIKIVSVGGAGLNALDRIVLDGLERADVVAINTDVQLTDEFSCDAQSAVGP